jgi:hypothetical protein
VDEVSLLLLPDFVGDLIHRSLLSSSLAGHVHKAPMKNPCCHGLENSLPVVI